MHLALFGGSFDPPHVGHQMAMLYVLATARVDRLLMVPCFRHPFDKPLTPFEHRLAMARLAAEPLGSRVEVSDLERRLGGDSRTLLTVRALLEERPGARVSVVIGSDLLVERERWYGHAELSALSDFIVIDRAGQASAAPGGVAIPDVSSSEIRMRLRRGEPIDRWVSSAVADYIVAHGLYREAG